MTRSRAAWAGHVCLSLSILVTLSTTSVRAQSPPATLVPGGPAVEAGLEGDGKHSYRVELRAGQLLKVEVEQRGIDVALTLQGPAGVLLEDMDLVTGPVGPEELRWEATASAPYVLEVLASARVANAGRYSVRLEVAEGAGPRDRAWIAAQQLLMHGRHRQQSTGEDSEAAIRSFEAALPKWREAEDPRWEAVTLLNLGIVRLRLNRTEAARDAYEQALVIQRRIGDRRAEASTLSNLGNAYHAMTQYARARECYEQALVLRREVGDRRGEASTLVNLANVYVQEGLYEDARDLFERSLAMVREVKDRRNEGVTLANLGSVYAELGDHDRARGYFEQALAISRETKDRRREAAALGSLGLTAHAAGHDDQALDHYQRSLSLWREVKGRDGEAHVLNDMGDAYLRLEQLAKARELYGQALLISREIKEPISEATALANLGIAHGKEGDEARARDHLAQALAIARRIKHRSAEGAYLYQLALLDRRGGDLAAARDRAVAALAIVESLRSDTRAHDLSSSFFASVQDYFALAIDLQMEMHGREPQPGHAAAALETSERARARGLLDLLAEARAQVREGADAQLAAREHELQRQLDATAAARYRLLAGEHTPDEEASLDKRIDALAEEYRVVQAQLRRSSPRYSALVQPQPLTVAQMQAQLDGDTVLLVYWLGSADAPRGWLFSVTPDSLESYELPARGVVEAAARRFLDAFVEGKGARADEKAADDLGRMLLSPVAARLGRKRLVVVSDGVLQYVPFAALPIPPPAPRTTRDGGRPLIVDHEIVHEASVSSLAVLRDELSGRSAAPKAVAVLADPVFEKDDARVAGPGKSATASAAPTAGTRSVLERALATVRVRASGAGLPRLPFARREAEAIAAVAPPGVILKALDFQASRQTATSDELARYRVVHFATHGLLDAEHPELSGLVLSLVDEAGRDQDGFLRLHDIYNLHLPAELVVLSACQTGLGRDIRGEGLVGLTRGFMYAGAARVVASLWQVDDVATAELMRAFYKAMLRDGQRPAAALRAAQVEMWRKPAWRSPYYWAGFVLQGEWR